MPLLPVVRRTLGLGTLAGVGLAYAAWEARQYTLRRVTVPLLPSGHAPLKVLHLSDIHMAPDQRAKQDWLRGLADLEPDLVSRLLFGMVNSLVEWYRPSGPVDVEQLADAVTAIAFEGLDR